jgi:phosphatidylinositol glycan class H protein
VLSGTVGRCCLSYTMTSSSCAESVVILPPHGVQLESRHGLPSLPLFTMRRFIPLTTLQDVVINEGLRGWDVRYYLAAIQQVGPRSSVVEVAYKVSYLLEGKHLD